LSGDSNELDDNSEAEFRDLLDEALENKQSGFSSSPSALDQLKELQRMNSDADSGFLGFGSSLRKFRACTKLGIELFQAGDLEGAIREFDSAVSSNSTQPLVQRGITLYCLGRYEEAATQLKRDVERIESSKTYKASDLRLWLSACMNRLGKSDLAKAVLDLNAYATEGNTLTDSNFLMKNLLLFFGGQQTLEDLLEVIGGSCEEKESRSGPGAIFYGNFYLGLYFDAIGEVDLAKAFLEIPASSTKYSRNDMWYHLPRVMLGRLK